jgi:hypothetical protein
MTEPTRTTDPTDDVNRLHVLITVFNGAMGQTPQDMHLRRRARIALDRLPEEVARELGSAALTFATLANESLEGRTESEPSSD